MRRDRKPKSGKNLSLYAVVWFFITLVFAAGYLAASSLQSSGSFSVPQWLVFLWIAGGCFSAYQFTMYAGILLSGGTDDDDGPDSLSR